MKQTRKPDWDELARRYATPDFIAQDPVSFPHRFVNHPDWRNVECAGFLAALFSYGRRESILKTLDQLFERLGDDPVATLSHTPPADLEKRFRGFYYRFNTAGDLVLILRRLGEIYGGNGSLKLVWDDIYRTGPGLRLAIHRFRQAFLGKNTLDNPAISYGLKFLFADPLQNSAAKRFNMFLRWMVRQDAVDFGLWQDVTPPADLVIPLDTHVGAMARRFCITRRKSNDWKTAEEITQYFRKRCPSDPARYDFALFGLGLAQRL